MREISSASNPQFKTWRSLLNSNGIKSEGLFLLSGSKLVREFLKSPNFEIAAELVPQDSVPLQTQAPAYQLSNPLFKELDVIGTHSNVLVLKTNELPVSSAQDKVSGLEVIAPVGDPGNLGALIRTCVAFGVSKIHLTQESSNPYHPKCVKASAGALLKAPLFKSGPLTSWDHETVWALDAKGESIKTVSKPQNARILVGEEGPGLPNLRFVKWISIPTENVESLNATVAASLVIYALKN